MNLIYQDSLYYAMTISEDGRDSVDKIFPIIDVLSIEKDETFIDVFIPFYRYFPYENNDIFIHYTFDTLINDKGYKLPRENKVKLSKNSPKTTIRIQSNNSGGYLFYGLLTIDDEKVAHFNQNFFEREIIVE